MKKFKCLRCGKCCSEFDEGGFPLFEWEARKFLKLAKKKEVDLELIPKYPLFDEVSGVVFFPYYVIEKGPCPFLKKKCEIYKDRALICRSFPLYKSPDKKVDRSYFMICPNFNLKEFLKEKDYSVFSKEQIKSVKTANAIAKFVDEKIKDLKEKGKIRLRIASEYDLGNSEIIPVFEFFKRVGIKKPKEFK